MKVNEIAALLNEPACAHNTQEKTACARPKPSATAGGCAFDGAQIALLPIADVAHIVHGSIACAGSSWDNRGTRTTGPALYRIGMTTDLTEQDVIMGRGEKRLFHAIKQAIDDYAPAAVFVYATCVTALTGRPRGSVQGGGRALGRAGGAGRLLRFLRHQEPRQPHRRRGDAAVRDRHARTRPRSRVGAPAGHQGARRDADRRVQHRRRVLAGRAALRRTRLAIIASLSGDSRYREIQTMHRAEASMVVCAKELLNVARKVEAGWGVPFFEGSFYGVADTSQAFRDFARLLEDADLSARTEAMIAREEAKINAMLEPWRARLKGKRALLYTGGVKSWSVVSALQDLGVEVVATGTRKSTGEDKARIRELMGEDARMLDEGSPKILLSAFKEYGADILIAGGRNLYTALKARIPFLDINQEREFGYAGYAGMVELAPQLALSIYCVCKDFP